MKIGIIKERKNPPDRRVVFSPEKLKLLKEKYPSIEVVVESSDIRIFHDDDYREKGFEISDDVSDCDVLLGVKEVPVQALIPNKKYFFFSHTIKKQPYNRNLLRAILEKNIELYDHETIKAPDGGRLVGFGRFAGIVGAYNGFRAYGLREKKYELSKVEDLPDYNTVKKELGKVILPSGFKILLTGRANVSKGALEIIKELNIKEVSVEEYLNQEFNYPVFCQIHVLDYNKRKDGQKLDNQDFYQHPEEYVSDFLKYAKVTDYFIAGHFYAEGAPYLFTREDARKEDFKIKVIADVSCDIDGPVASTIRPSTIADPFYGYHPETEQEVEFDHPDAITVMAVDNLPCELPKDASEEFGKMFLEHVIPAFFNQDKDQVLKRAKITENGELTPKYQYLQDYVDQVKISD